MTKNLPQLYREVPKALVPYVGDEAQQMMLIAVDPALPCFICAQPAYAALITAAPGQSSGSGTAWLTFPICNACEKRQVHHQTQSG